MDLYKPIYTSVVKPLWLKYKKAYHPKYHRDIQRFHTLRIEQMRSRQLQKLQRIVEHAYNYVPFYRREWDAGGFKPQDIQTLGDIKRIPILTKDKLRSQNQEFVSEKTNERELIVRKTGGTTTTPVRFLYSQERMLYKTAEMDFFRQWWNWDFGDKVAYLWGAPQDFPDLTSARWKVYNAIFGRNLFMISSLLDEAIMETYARKMIRFRPAILQAYPNPAYIFSQFIRRKGIRMPPLKSVILTAEPIHDYQRQAVEEVFNAPVYTFYGARESGYAGVECDMHDGYHVNCSSLYVEFLEGNSDVRPGDMGNIVFTDLLNMDMPLIRYMIEDMGIPVPGSCPCGSALPKMKFSAGRETDVFVTPDGKYVPGVALAGDIGDCEGIAALQMIQDKPDQLVVKIVKSEKFSEKDIAVLDKQIFTYFKHAVQVTKEFVDEIPKTKSGKIRLYISNVPKHGDCL